MRTLGLLACIGSIAALACSGSDDKTQQNVNGAPGTGGVVGAAGGAGVPVTGGAGVPVTGGAGVPVTSGAGGLVGAGGAVVTGAGGVATGAGGVTGTAGIGGGGVPTGSGGAAGGAPAGGAGGAAATPDPPNTVTLKTDSFQLAPGQEIYKCQNFDNPFGGKDAALNRIVTDMAPGSHHLHVYNLTEGASRSLEDCAISDFHALVHAAGSPHAETDYPDGMATKIKGSTGLRIQLHYLNVGTDMLTVGATLKLSPVPDISTITKWVAELYFNRIQLSVPPGMGQKVTTTCAFPNTYGQIGLVGGGTHMHMRGVRETAKTSTGAMLADATTWNEPPPISYNPPIIMNPGDSITWECTYDNTTSKTFTFGDSASDNEMCIYLARYYSLNANDTQVACQAASTNGGTASPMPY
jgi:hypothetical protein